MARASEAERSGGQRGPAASGAAASGAAASGAAASGAAASGSCDSAASAPAPGAPAATARAASAPAAVGSPDSMARGMWDRFWCWYERHYLVNVAFASGLFVLQLVHLYWLAADPIAARLTGDALFDPSGVVRYLIFFVDYTEIPALVAVSLVYVNELRGGRSLKPLLFLALLNSQWLHIFWITDEYVGNELAGQATVSSLPGWLAWVAILIDYGELPVIWDTLRRAARALIAGPRAAPLRR
jgi:hypothetical protein